MIIQHNMQAANGNRMLGKVVTDQAKSTEKLSSGYRINRAADDAAGLSISEKMRGQIRGLNQASTNAQDGISLIQTAEGALNETHSILQRMRELSVQSANGTETNDDREAIQDEISQLQDELDRIADTTEFNTMKLLDGSLDGSSSSTSSAGPAFGVYDTGLKAFVSSNVTGVKVSVSATAKAGAESAIWDEAGTTLTLNLVKDKTYDQKTIDNLIANAKQEQSSATATPAQVSVKLSSDLTAATYNADGSLATAGEYTLSLQAGKTYTEEDIEDLLKEAGLDYDVTLSGPNPDNNDEANTLFVTNSKVAVDLTLANGAGLGDTDAYLGQTHYDVAVAGEGGLTLQIGANEGQTMKLSIGNMSAKALGVSGNSVDISTQDGASEATTTIDNAIKKVSAQRSTLGAVQNRLEHTISNLDTSSENLQTAESRIRDVDMAEEMVTYSKNSILQQAAQSMLAQANQSTQGVLSLLQ